MCVRFVPGERSGGSHPLALEAHGALLSGGCETDEVVGAIFVGAINWRAVHNQLRRRAEWLKGHRRARGRRERKGFQERRSAAKRRARLPATAPPPLLPSPYACPYRTRPPLTVAPTPPSSPVQTGRTSLPLPLLPGTNRTHISPPRRTNGTRTPTPPCRARAGTVGGSVREREGGGTSTEESAAASGEPGMVGESVG
jgi:hypothetical protein